jgi:hypothetical protein
MMSNAFQVAAERAVASCSEEWHRLTLSEQCQAIYGALHELDAKSVRLDRVLSERIELLAAD